MNRNEQKWTTAIKQLLDFVQFRPTPAFVEKKTVDFYWKKSKLCLTGKGNWNEIMGGEKMDTPLSRSGATDGTPPLRPPPPTDWPPPVRICATCTKNQPHRPNNCTNPTQAANPAPVPRSDLIAKKASPTQKRKKTDTSHRTRTRNPTRPPRLPFSLYYRASTGFFRRCRVFILPRGFRAFTGRLCGLNGDGVFPALFFSVFLCFHT